MWGKPYKDTFTQLAQTPEQRANAEAWLNQWKESQGYITKKEQEHADLRKRFDPLHEILAPYEQGWRQQGMDTVAGVRQLVSYAEALARNPAEMIPQLARMYGVDLQALVAEQPYIDPHLQQIQQQFQRIEQSQLQQQQWAQQQQTSALADQVKAFEQATDDTGALKAPHFSRVFDRMLGIARGGLAKTIQDAYDMAVATDKDLQAEIAVQREQKVAVEKAAQAKRAIDAGKTVRSKATADDPPAKSLRDELAEGLTAAGYN